MQPKKMLKFHKISLSLNNKTSTYLKNSVYHKFVIKNIITDVCHDKKGSLTGQGILYKYS